MQQRRSHQTLTPDGRVRSQVRTTACGGRTVSAACYWNKKWYSSASAIVLLVPELMREFRVPFLLSHRHVPHTITHSIVHPRSHDSIASTLPLSTWHRPMRTSSPRTGMPFRTYCMELGPNRYIPRASKTRSRSYQISDVGAAIEGFGHLSFTRQSRASRRQRGRARGRRRLVLAGVGRTRERQKEIGPPGFVSRRRAVVEGGEIQKMLAVLYTYHLSANFNIRDSLNSMSIPKRSAYPRAK